MKRWIIVLIVALLHGCSPSEVADRILVGGTIITVDPNDTIVEALAIKDGRILAVGTNREIEAFARESTERIELAGWSVT
jgi:predicted amidohydrolase YtcJ